MITASEFLKWLEVFNVPFGGPGGGASPAVQAATTGNFAATYNNGSSGIGATLTATATGTVTFDGVLTVLNGTYLLKDQTTASQNGIYLCTTAGAVGVAAVFTRATTYDTVQKINEAGVIPVTNGTTQAGYGYYQTAIVTAIGVSSLVYVRFGNSGTVTSVDTGTGLTGGPITQSGTISLATIATNTLLANITDLTAPPVPNSLSTIFDTILGNTQGSVIYRNATTWTSLSPGTLGQYLTSGGPSANITWQTGGGSYNPNQTIYFVVGGDDSAPGTIDQPLATLNQALTNALLLTGPVSIIGLGVGVVTDEFSLTVASPISLDIFMPTWTFDVTGDAITVAVSGSTASYFNMSTGQVSASGYGYNLLDFPIALGSVCRLTASGGILGNVNVNSSTSQLITDVISGTYTHSGSNVFIDCEYGIQTLPFHSTQTSGGLVGQSNTTYFGDLYFDGNCNYPRQLEIFLAGDLTVSSYHQGVLIINATTNNYTVTLPDTSGQLDYSGNPVTFIPGFPIEFLNLSTGSITLAAGGVATLIGTTVINNVSQRVKSNYTATNTWQADYVPVSEVDFQLPGVYFSQYLNYVSGTGEITNPVITMGGALAIAGTPGNPQNVIGLDAASYFENINVVSTNLNILAPSAVLDPATGTALTVSVQVGEQMFNFLGIEGGSSGFSPAIDCTYAGGSGGTINLSCGYINGSVNTISADIFGISNIINGDVTTLGAGVVSLLCSQFNGTPSGNVNILSPFGSTTSDFILGFSSIQSQLSVNAGDGGSILGFLAQPNSGIYNITVQNASFNQSSNLYLADPGVSDGAIPTINATSVVSGNVPVFTGTQGAIQDSGYPIGDIVPLNLSGIYFSQDTGNDTTGTGAITTQYASPQKAITEAGTPSVNTSLIGTDAATYLGNVVVTHSDIDIFARQATFTSNTGDVFTYSGVGGVYGMEVGLIVSPPGYKAINNSGTANLLVQAAAIVGDVSNTSAVLQMEATEIQGDIDAGTGTVYYSTTLRSGTNTGSVIGISPSGSTSPVFELGFSSQQSQLNINAGDGSVLTWIAQDTAGPYTVTCQNGSFGQDTTLTIPDPLTSSANFAMSPTSVTSSNIPSFNGTEGLLQDSGLPIANVPTSGGTSTYVWTANGASPPTWQAAAGGFVPIPVVTISGTTQSAAINTAYIVGNASQTTITLPTTFAVGSIIKIVGLGAGGWIAQAGTGTTLRFGEATSSSGGTATSAAAHNVIQFSGLVANSVWTTDFALSSGITLT